MRVALLCDIHSNLPALDAVLIEVREAEVDAIVVGGDTLPGPMPRETLERLFNLDIPTHIVHGNGDLAVLAQLAAADPSEVTYWGTTSGEPLPPPLVDEVRWAAEQVAHYQGVIHSWPKSLTLDITGLGPVLFCHATPHDETAIITRVTPEDRALPLLANVEEAVIGCGHTHMQMDRTVAGKRIVNAGSVGMCTDRTGADWLLLGPEVEFRHTDYDLDAAAALVRSTTYSSAEHFASRTILAPPSEDRMLRAFGEIE
jgi:predicted phosphodiesterase